MRRYWKLFSAILFLCQVEEFKILAHHYWTCQYWGTSDEKSLRIVVFSYLLTPTESWDLPTELAKGMNEWVGELTSSYACMWPEFYF